MVHSTTMYKIGAPPPKVTTLVVHHDVSSEVECEMWNITTKQVHKSYELVQNKCETMLQVAYLKCVKY